MANTTVNQSKETKPKKRKFRHFLIGLTTTVSIALGLSKFVADRYPTLAERKLAAVQTINEKDKIKQTTIKQAPSERANSHEETEKKEDKKYQVVDENESNNTQTEEQRGEEESTIVAQNEQEEEENNQSLLAIQDTVGYYAVFGDDMREPFRRAFIKQVFGLSDDELSTISYSMRGPWPIKGGKKGIESLFLVIPPDKLDPEALSKIGNGWKSYPSGERVTSRRNEEDIGTSFAAYNYKGDLIWGFEIRQPSYLVGIPLSGLNVNPNKVFEWSVGRLTFSLTLRELSELSNNKYLLAPSVPVWTYHDLSITTAGGNSLSLGEVLANNSKLINSIGDAFDNEGFMGVISLMEEKGLLKVDGWKSVNVFAYIQGQNPVFRRIADKLTEGSTSQEEKAQKLLDFVTTDIAYDFENANYEQETNSEVILDPQDVLFHREGDCNNKVNLFATLLEQYKIPFVLIHYKHHVNVAVQGDFPLANGLNFVWKGKRYFIAETTAKGFQIGLSRTGYVDEQTGESRELGLDDVITIQDNPFTYYKVYGFKDEEGGKVPIVKPYSFAGVSLKTWKKLKEEGEADNFIKAMKILLGASKAKEEDGY